MGDDIVFGDKSLYVEYRKILDAYGVSVSESKTHESTSLMEFAKRWVFRGEEISPLPLPAFKQARLNYNALVPLFHTERKRGVHLSQGLVAACERYIRIRSKGRVSSAYLKMLRKRCVIAASTLEWWDGDIKSLAFVRNICKE